jgi:hypothetical protein
MANIDVQIAAMKLAFVPNLRQLSKTTACTYLLIVAKCKNKK